MKYIEISFACCSWQVYCWQSYSSSSEMIICWNDNMVVWQTQILLTIIFCLWIDMLHWRSLLIIKVYPLQKGTFSTSNIIYFWNSSQLKKGFKITLSCFIRNNKIPIIYIQKATFYNRPVLQKRELHQYDHFLGTNISAFWLSTFHHIFLP